MMHETTTRLAPTQFRDRVVGCFAGKLIGFLIGTEPQLLDHLTIENLRQYSGSTIFGCFNHDLASLQAFRQKQGHPSSFDIAQEWLSQGRYEDPSISQVYENLTRGLYPPLSSAYRRRAVDPAACWSRTHLWVFLSQDRENWLEKVIQADAEIDCCSNGSASYAPALAAAQASVLQGYSIEEALRNVLISRRYDNASLAIECAIDAAKGYRDLHEAMDSFLFSSKRKAITKGGSRFGALVLLWMHYDGSIIYALSASNTFGLLSPTFGATLGGLLGLSSGKDTAGEKLGDRILEITKTVRITSDRSIDLSVFADEVSQAALQIADACNTSVSELPSEYRSRKQDSPLKKSPYRVAVSTDGVDIELDYIHEPEFHICSSRMLSLSIRSKDLEKRQVNLSWSVSDGASISPAKTETVLHPNTRRVFTVNCFAFRATEWIEGSVSVTFNNNEKVLRPFALALAPTVRYDSLTLKPGITVSADSEARSAPGCLRFVIDGHIDIADDENHEYWESDNTEGPHWLQINLPKPMRANRIVVHFADRLCHPESFKAMVSDDGAAWTIIGEEDGYANENVYEIGPFDLRIKSFRFVIARSSNPLTPNVSKVSEIEMIPLGRGRNRVR